MNQSHSRLSREKNTIVLMVSIYCHETHGSTSQSLCLECQEFLAYALARLNRCPFQEKKSTCAKCAIHCYKSDMRKKAKEIMSFAGPKMLLRHPILAIHHMVDGLRKPPSLQKANSHPLKGKTGPHAQ